MIKNIIFDMGKVIVDFCWREHFENMGLYGETLERVADATVRSPLWNEFDRGVISEQEVVDLMVEQNPSLEKEIRLVLKVEDFPKMIRKFPYTDGLIDGLKAAGYNIYILSNFPYTSYNNSPHCLDFIEKTDGQIISYIYQILKPQPEIYNLLLDKYKLNAGECIFIDDKPENVAGAENCGIMSIQFTGYDDLIHTLRSMEIIA